MRIRGKGIREEGLREEVLREEGLWVEGLRKRKEVCVYERIKGGSTMVIKRSITCLAIAVIMSAFISCRNNNSSLPDPLEAGWNNQSVCELMQDDSNLRVLKCTFPPGVGHERHYHDPHFGYTISGSRFQITDTTGTREVDVITGSTFSNEFMDWHEVLNVGDSTAIFLIVEYK